MMKWLAGLLLLANVALYLWGGDFGFRGGAPATDVTDAEAQADVNVETMQLLREVLPPAGDAVVETSAAIQPSGLDAGGAARPTPSPGGRACLRIGPFKGGAGWAAANAWLRAQGFDFQAIRSQRRATRVARVFLGPFASRAAAAPTVAWLKDNEIDNFIETDSPDSATGEVTISLGYFTQRALAEKFVALLQARGIQARVRDHYRDLGPYDWLETAADAARRDSLLARRWTDPGAVAVEIDCGELAESDAGGDADADG